MMIPSDAPSGDMLSGPPARRISDRRKNALTFVSHAADNMIADLEQAMQAMLIAADRQSIGRAYDHLCLCRKALYTHISGLEGLAGEPRNVSKRF